MTERNSNESQAYIDWKAWNAKEFGDFTKEEGVQFAAEMKAAGAHLTASTKLLEIGFGNAAFAGWVRTVASQYVGTEANLQLVARAKSLGMEAYPSTTSLPAVAAGRKFDLIVIFDVLEHLAIDEIVATLQACREALSNDGLIVLRVPSGDSPFSGPLRYGDITHKTFLGTHAIMQLAKITGLDVTSIHDAAFPILGQGMRVAITRTFVACCRKIIGKLINAAFNGNSKAVMSINMVAVLRLQRPH